MSTKQELLNKLYRLVRKRAGLERHKHTLESRIPSVTRDIFDVDMKIDKVLTELERAGT